MRVWLDPAAMAARGITVADVTAALEAENVELPAGELETG
jgi:multidrug efflux pump